MRGLYSVLPPLWRIARERRLCRDYDSFLGVVRELGGDLLDGGTPFPSEDPGAEESGEDRDFDWRALGELFWREGDLLDNRRLAGSFYTPERIIDQILDLLWDDLRPGSPGKKAPPAVCDPAMGCGFFYLRLIDRLLEGGMTRAKIRAWAGRALHGVDKEAGAVVLARLFLWLSLSEKGREFRPDPAHFRCGDSLAGPGFGQEGEGPDDAVDWTGAFGRVAAAGGFDVVLGNPPYEVLTNFARHPESRERAEALRSSGWYRDSVRGQINLYRCFIERGLGLLKPGGALSFVVPLSLARDGTATELRRRLLGREAAADWFMYDEGEALFQGVTQSACVFAARREGGKARRVRVRSARGEAALSADELSGFGGGSSAIPEIGADGLRLWRWIRENVSGTLGQLAEMRVGEVDQTVYRDCMRDDMPADIPADIPDRSGGRVLARGAHLRAFWLDVRPEPGRERFLDEERFLAMKGAAAEQCRRRAGEWRVVQLGIRNMRTRPRLVAGLAPPGVYLGNSLNVYYPKEGVGLGFLCGLLNSRLLDWLFCLGSGNNNINLSEMMLLPCPGAEDGGVAGDIEQAFGQCEKRARTGGDCVSERLLLDRQVERFYGVPAKLIKAVFSGT